MGDIGVERREVVFEPVTQPEVGPQPGAPTPAVPSRQPAAPSPGPFVRA